MAINRPASVYEDPALQNLLAKVPDRVKETFTEEQLSYLRNASINRQWRNHSVDLRGTIPWFKYRYYYVFIAGKNNRELSRAEQKASRIIIAVFLVGFLCVSITFGLLALYLLKSALGINLFDNFSLGIWDWFKKL
ncbi:3-phosphoshikimate 1-carboxyvinyltransferase [Paraglaciecola sp. MB-3u-78]|uniref:3-phosphoshikimate 1-carboxyvinyltransferase n=1 Tax=Paraglaciecola sp. MB-3u-78 TaxID=2058332 RepID=UPI000C34E15F|nr:3-phosphoshikimate 1-carboxyvinyltransferase [Paraglaciecola sp. MB-3u-78]PKG98741.1 3-phosphoshikimate 1-carboxyvinyltransferase [Paraglaciecola sp. MB-3u-78]